MIKSIEEVQPLTRRLREVCVCLLLGCTPAEAAAKLGISRRTVETYLLIIKAAYGVRTTNQLIFAMWKQAGYGLMAGEPNETEKGCNLDRDAGRAGADHDHAGACA